MKSHKQLPLHASLPAALPRLTRPCGPPIGSGRHCRPRTTPCTSIFWGVYPSRRTGPQGRTPVLAGGRRAGGRGSHCSSRAFVLGGQCDAPRALWSAQPLPASSVKRSSLLGQLAWGPSPGATVAQRRGVPSAGCKGVCQPLARTLFPLFLVPARPPSPRPNPVTLRPMRVPAQPLVFSTMAAAAAFLSTPPHLGSRCSAALRPPPKRDGLACARGCCSWHGRWHCPFQRTLPRRRSGRPPRPAPIVETEGDRPPLSPDPLCNCLHTTGQS